MRKAWKAKRGLYLKGGTLGFAVKASGGKNAPKTDMVFVMKEK
jgi:hypothetical protein